MTDQLNKLLLENINYIKHSVKSIDCEFESDEKLSIAIEHIIRSIKEKDLQRPDIKTIIYKLAYYSLVKELRKYNIPAYIFKSIKNKTATKDTQLAYDRYTNKVSLDQNLFENLNVSDTVSDKRVHIENDYIKDEYVNFVRELVKRTVNNLPKEHKDIVKDKFYNNKTFKEIAKDLGVTRQRVQQIYSRKIEPVLYSELKYLKNEI